MSDVFLALADPTRREILRMVARQPRNAGDVASAFAQQRPAISKHLAVLRDAGLVSERRDRQRRVYSLNPTGLLPIRAFLGILTASESPTGQPEREHESPIDPVASVIRVVAKPREKGPSEFQRAVRAPDITPRPALEAPPVSLDRPIHATSDQQPAERASVHTPPGQWDMDFD